MIGQEGDVVSLAISFGQARRGRDARRPQPGAGVKVVIAGAGAVGSFLAQDLSSNGHEILVIDKNPVGRATRRTAEDHRHHRRRLRGGRPPSKPSSTEADVVIAATGDDEDNLVISLLAKQEFAVPRVIARVNHPKNHWLFNETGGSTSRSPPRTCSRHSSRRRSRSARSCTSCSSRGQTRLVEVTSRSPRQPRRQTIDAIGCLAGSRSWPWCGRGRVVVPRGDTQLTSR
jgi:trk system potassium uptake protein TrkA